MVVPERNESNADLIAYNYGLIVTAGAIQKIIMISQGEHLLVSFFLLLNVQYDSGIPLEKKREVMFVEFDSKDTSRLKEVQ